LIKRQVALNDTFVSLEVFMRTDTRATWYHQLEICRPPELILYASEAGDLSPDLQSFPSAYWDYECDVHEQDCAGMREAMGSNIGGDTAYRDWQFSWISSVPTYIFWDSTSIRPILSNSSIVL
jgi:hypothetical protein